jgi:drug/metabolite transporter (DMT)-like permease
MVSLVTLLVPVSALLGYAVLGERSAPHQLAGMGLIALGLILVDGRAITALQSRAKSGWS